MNIDLKLLSLTAVIMTVSANLAHAHAIDGFEAGLLHLVTNMDHMLVLLMTVSIGGIAIFRALNIRRALRAGRD